MKFLEYLQLNHSDFLESYNPFFELIEKIDFTSN